MLASYENFIFAWFASLHTTSTFIVCGFLKNFDCIIQIQVFFDMLDIMYQLPVDELEVHARQHWSFAYLMPLFGLVLYIHHLCHSGIINGLEKNMFG